jgi:lipopolysaccharide export system permease protein
LGKRVDRLVLKELWGPFFLGVAIFSVLIFAAVMLTRITEWIVQGISPMRVMELCLLTLPSVLTKSAPMATLLASLLAFGRLSSDSEIVALRAAGASLFRVMAPVATFCLIVAAAAFGINEFVVPAASARAAAIQIEVKKELDAERGKTTLSRAVNLKGADGKPAGTAIINAFDFSLAQQTLTGADIIFYNNEGQRTWWLQADQLRFFGQKDWRISGRARLMPADGSTIIELKEGAWPEQVEMPDVTPMNLFAGFVTDLDTLSMGQMRQEIEAQRNDPKPNMKQIRNLEFGYWNKITLPLGTLVFGLLGAPLGIRNQRTGMGAGFALAIGLTFAYLTLTNFMAVYSQGGVLPPIVASFTPLILGMVAAAYTISRKNG